MHTMVVSNNTVFHYNSDYSGNIEIASVNGSIEIPANDLIRFMTEIIRDKQTQRIESASLDELIGIAEKRGE